MGKFKRKSAEAKRNISKGVKASWRKRGTKVAVGGATAIGLSTLALYKNRKNILNTAEKLANNIDKKMAPKIEKFVYDAIKNPKPTNKVGRILSRFIPKESVKSAGVGATKAVKDITVETVESQAKKIVNLPKDAINLGIETRKAFDDGLNTPTDPNSKLNKGARWLARQRANMEKRAKADMKKLGFKKDLQDIGLIEFAKTQRRKKRTRTAAEKAAISQGLREYYAGQTKPKTSALDKVDRGTLTINRVTGTASNVLSTAALGLSLASQLKAMTYKPSRGERIFQNVSAGAGLLSSVSNSYRGFGTGTRSLAGSANIYDDLRIGAKTQKRNYQDAVLGVKRDINRTKRQSQAAKIRIERQRNRLKKEELGIRQKTAGSYGTIAATSAMSNRPGGAKYEDSRTRRAKLTKSQMKNLPEWQ